MTAPPWQQHTITFVDRDAAHSAVAGHLGPALTDAEAAGQVTGWWFLNKQPWPLRYRAAEPSPLIESVLRHLISSGAVVSWRRGIYEPETDAFGGSQAMDAAHELFHIDARHLLAYPPSPRHLGRRETLVVLASTLMRGAHLDWFEQGDVWSKVAALRPTAAPPPERNEAMATAVRTLMTIESHHLSARDGPFRDHEEWITAFTRAGETLCHLARNGDLTRGLRAVLAHHIIFHANRAGLTNDEQSILSTTAREVIMGKPEPTDRTSSPDRGKSGPDTVYPMNPDATVVTALPDAEPEAERLRNILVDRLREDGRVRTQAVETAMRTVPRHVFVPDAPLADAYNNAPVHIKHDTEGASISCASQPSVVGTMLDQLDVQPGHRVLELGAGTGYNAALLAHLAGDAGHVVTLDVDDDLVDGARAHLAAAGIDNVTAVTRDGALGYTEAAPYDRIIATVGAHGIPHAWLDQLAPDGRLVIPQRLKGSVCRSIAYQRRDGRWLSLSSNMNTFMPLRRGIADDDRRVIPLSTDGTVRLQAPASLDADLDAFAGILDQPRTETWTGVTVRAMESPEWMELFVTTATPSGLVRMLFPQDAKGGLLTDDPYPSSTASVHNGALTYLARRLSEEKTPDGGKLWEFGVIGHGPGNSDLAATIADAIRAWDRDYRGREATFEIQPLSTVVTDDTDVVALDTPLNRILIDWR